MDMQHTKAEIASFMERCYRKGLTTSTGGNISARCGDIMLITPSGKDKASLSADDIAEVRLSDGANLSPDKKLSIESGMHRAVYLACPDAGAVVHCHPLYSCLFSASDEEIDTTLIAESWYLLDRVAKVPYALMGTEELAVRVAGYAEKGCRAMLLENHGAVAVGRTILEAFDRLECMEQAAELSYLSHSVRAHGIAKEERERISRMR